MIGSLISAGSSLVGGIINGIGQKKTNEMNMKINQMNNEFNERMLDKQLAYQEQMWNKTNEYNSASNQRARLEEAGLNPYMMMSGGNAGTATSQSGGSASAASPISMQNAGAAAVQGMSQVGQFATQVGLAKAEIANKQEATIGQQMANDWYVQRQLAELGLISSQTRDKDAAAAINNQRYRFNLESWESQLEGLEARNQMNRALAANAFADAAYTSLRTTSQAWQNLALPEMLKLQLLTGWANLDLTKSKTRTECTQALLNLAQKNNVELSTKQAEELYDDVVEYKRSQMQWQVDYNNAYSAWTNIVTRCIQR